LYIIIKKKVGFNKTIIFLFLFISIPANYDHLAGRYAGYADLPMAAFMVACIFYFLYWIEEKYTNSLRFSLLFASLACNIKEDGLAFFAIILGLSFMILIKRKQFLNNIKEYIPALLIASPWYILREFFQLPSMLDASSGIHMDRLFLVIKNVFYQFISVQNFNLLFPFFIISIIYVLLKRKINNVIILFSILSSLIIADIFVFTITPLDPVKHIESLADRMLYVLSPIIIIFLAKIYSIFIVYRDRNIDHYYER
jgi:hypothetical protein